MEHDERRLPHAELLLALTFSLVGCPGHGHQCVEDEEEELILVDQAAPEEDGEEAIDMTDVLDELDRDVREALREELGGEDEAS